MHSDSDRTLLRKWIENQSHEAFRALVDRYAPLAWGVASRRLTNPIARQDAVQQVFIDLAKKAPSLVKIDRPLGPWLHRCAVLVCLQEIRRESRRSKQMKRLAAEESPPEENRAPLLEEILPQLDNAILTLNEKDRQIILGKFYQRKTYRQIAQASDDSEAAVQRRGHRALEKLAQKLRKRGAIVPLSALTGGLSIALAPPAPAAVIDSTCSAAVSTPAMGFFTELKNVIPPLTTPAASLFVAFVFGLSIPLVSARLLTKKEPEAPDPIQKAMGEKQTRLSALNPKITDPPKLTGSGLDLEALRRELEKLPDASNRKARELELRRVMYALQDDDIPSVHELIRGLSHDVLPYAAEVIESFFGRWAESDIETAISAMEPLLDGRKPDGKPVLRLYRIAGEAVLVWAMEDADAAWAWLGNNAKSVLDWRWAGGTVLGGLAERGTPIRDLLDLADATPLAVGKQELQKRVLRPWLSGDQQAEALEHLAERYSPEVSANLIGQIALKNAQSHEAYRSTIALLGEIQVLDQRVGVAREMFRKWFAREPRVAWDATLKQEEALAPIIGKLPTSTNPYWIAGKFFGSEWRAEAEEAMSQLSDPKTKNLFVDGMMDGLSESEKTQLKAELMPPIER